MPRSRILLALCALLVFVATAPANAHGPRPKPRPERVELYPTDQCVASKLRAAADYCAASVGVRSVSSWGWLGPWFGGWGRAQDRTKHERWLGIPRHKLERAWVEAEDRSAAAGVSCEETTVSAAEMISLIDEGALGLADEVDGSPHCRTRRIVSAAAACRQLLDAESLHLVERSQDRLRKRLDARQERTLDKFEHHWKHGCRDREPAPTDALVSLADAAFESSVVSPAVPTEWTMIDPPDEVPYASELGDQVLEPICSRGTPWVYFVKRGTVNKTIVYYQGGGACWNAATCGLGTFKPETGPGDNPANATTGFADFTNPENPFRDWNAVFVPYCTGDVHWGDAVVEHSPDGSATIRHKGRINAAVAEKFAREHFVSPDQVFVTGSSAGSYGAVVNALALQEFAWPSAPFAVVGDGGNGVITQEFLENDLAKWGIEKNLPRWIPGLDKPLTELNASDLWTEAALFYPQSRFANYSTAYDGGTGGQVGFYNVMLNPDNFLEWLNWWKPSCEWNDEMRGLVQMSAAAAPANYRYYVGVGSRHTMWGNDKVYTDTSGGVPTIVSWLEAMLAGSPAWTNVECTDCGQLLPGDPRPNPVQPPYVTDPATSETRIVCD
jgi:hypothetical protein